jgi:hypothetical protein
MITEILEPVLASNAASDSIKDNLLAILFFIGATIVIIAVMTILDQWSRFSYRAKVDEIESKLEKLKRYAQSQKRKALRDSIAMLNQSEREHLFSLWEDNAVISRKALFRLNELEDRLRRSERGTELRWAEARIDEVKETEKRLFPDQFKNGGRKRK